MRFDAKKILASKRAMRRNLAMRPIAEKLRMLDALRECALTLRPMRTSSAINCDNAHRIV
jgi:hypothetical protein